MKLTCYCRTHDMSPGAYLQLSEEGQREHHRRIAECEICAPKRRASFECKEVKP